jgi:DNA helicase-2/ATP-dependent DNA helicase PcrA
LLTQRAPQPWPQPLEPASLALRQASADAVAQARRRAAATGRYEPAVESADQLLLDGEEVVAGWDADIERLLDELVQARSHSRLVELPSTMSTTALLRLHEDPDGFAAELARPMPRPPSRAARFGTRFHQWVERHFAGGLTSGRIGQSQLVDPDDLPDRADAGAEGEEELRELCQRFAEGQFGETVPYAVESPFTLLVAGRLVRGRIDAVYEVPDGDGPAAAGGRYRVVDWKTNRSEAADPLQLAIYRLAWAEVCQVPLEQVDAVFYYVRSDQVVRPPTLPDRAEIEQLLVRPDAGASGVSSGRSGRPW